MKPYSLLPVFTLVSAFVFQPLMAGDHKKKPAPDRYIQNYERKLADLEKRMQDTGKMLKQANADFREQTERKQRELKELAEEYKQREARAKKAIKEYGEQHNSVAAVLKKYRVELAAKKQQQEAKVRAVEAAKKKEESKKTVAARKPAPKPKVDPKSREVIRKRAEESRRAHLKRFDANRDGKVTKEESKAVLAAEAKRRDAARKKSSETRKSLNEDARKKPVPKKPTPKKVATKKPAPKRPTQKPDLDRLRANYVKAQKSDQSAKGLYAKAKRAYEYARRK